MNICPASVNIWMFSCRALAASYKAILESWLGFFFFSFNGSLNDLTGFTEVKHKTQNLFFPL